MAESIRDMLLRHEGLRLKPYKDSVGKLTIGVGRNLDDVGISYDEAMMLLHHDMQRAEEHCRSAWPWFDGLTLERRGVLINMVFNMGLGGVMTFKRFLEAVSNGEYETAATEMLASQWAVQVGNRAKELAALMRGSTEV